MVERIEVAGDLLADLLEAYLRRARTSRSQEWAPLLRSARSAKFLGNTAGKEYWVDLYRGRQEVAASHDVAMAELLAVVVQELSEFDGDSLLLVLVNESEFGYFVWLDSALSSVISCFRGVDRRSSTTG